MAEGTRIQVVPDQLAGAGKAAQTTAKTVSQVRGEVNAASGYESGCGPQARGAFAAMQQAWLAQLGYLGESVGGLAAALGNASSAYPANDKSQCVVVWTTS